MTGNGCLWRLQKFLEIAIKKKKKRKRKWLLPAKLAEF